MIIIVPIYMLLTLLGIILMKLGGNPGTIAIKSGSLDMSMSIVSGIGFVCYICSFLLFTRMVIMFDLSYILPLCTGIIQVLILVAAAVIFKENFTTQSIIGSILIIIGVIIMNWKTN